MNARSTSPDAVAFPYPLPPKQTTVISTEAVHSTIVSSVAEILFDQP
jgi:hypothetical protein